MVQQPGSSFNHIPSYDIDVEITTSVLDLTKEEHEDIEPVPPTWSCQCFFRPSCWSICSAIALNTTKQLMGTHGFYNPFTIAFRAFGATLTIYILSGYVSTQSGKPPCRSTWSWSSRNPDGTLFSKRWCVMLPASVIAAFSFPILLRGILYMPSLPILAMLFPVIYAVESIVLFICCSASRTRKWLPWETILSLLASGIVLYNENRLEVTGLIWGVVGLLLIGFCRALFVIGSEQVEPSIRFGAYRDFTIMTLFIGTSLSGLGALAVENTRSIFPLHRDAIILVVTNILACIGAVLSGTSVLAYSPIPFEVETSCFSSIPIRSSDFFPPLVSSLLVLLANLHSSTPSYISWIQIFAYIVSAVSLIGVDQIHNHLSSYLDSTQQQINQSLGKDIVDFRKPNRLFTTGALFSLIFFSSWSLSILESASINSLPSGLHSKLDISYEAESRFDIVISMYQEDPLQVKEMLDRIKGTSPLRELEPRVIIYTKDPTADLYALKLSTGASTVLRLPNLGREGGTYLSHIIDQWDSLAQQTMFIQAHPHNMRELIPRINTYLVPETGMLNLGFAGVSCTCDRCGDMFDWEDKWNVVPALYERIYSHACTASTPPILLSYKGQFVASAQRIRGIEKKIYGGLLNTITSVDGWSHNSSVIGDMRGGTGVDSPDNPYFGFTVERVWGLLMQCATDQRVGARCPSLLSGGGTGGRVEDCQCLDRERA